MKPVVAFTLFSVILNLLTAFTLAFLIKKVRPDLRYYVLFNFSIGLWSLLYIPWILVTSVFSFQMIASLLMVSIILIPFAFLNFCYETTEISIPKFVNGYNILGFFTFSILAFTPSMIRGVYIPVMGFHFWPLAGTLFPLYLAYFGINFVLGHIVLYKNASNKKANIVTLGTFIAFFGGSTNFFLWFGIEIPPIGNIAICIYVLIILFAVTKHELFNVKVIINRTFAFTLTLTFFTLCYLTFLLPYHFYISEKTDLPVVLFSISFMMISGLNFEKVRYFCQTTAEKAFLKGRYDYRKAIRKFSKSIAETSTLTQILTTLQEHLSQDIEIAKGWIFLPIEYSSTESLHQDQGFELWNLANSTPTEQFFERGNPIFDTLSSLDYGHSKILTPKNQKINLQKHSPQGIIKSHPIRTYSLA